MKRSLKFLLKGFLFCFIIIGCFVSCGKPKTKTLQIGFTTAINPDDPYYVFATEFARLVEEKSKGNIKIDVLAGGQLGQEREMFEGMQLGTVDMAIMTNAYASNFVSASGVFDLPFIFKDSNTAAKILDSDLGTRVLNEYESKKVKALSWGEGGFRHLVTMNRGVTKPEDFKGLKIRCMETNTYIETYNALKANAVPMAWSETITGLQQKTIDGLDIPISVIYSNGFPEIAKYLSLTGHFYSPLVMCMSLDVWNDLDDQQKQIISDSSKEAGKLCRQHNQEVEQVLLEKMEEQGMKIIRDVDVKSFQNILGDFYMKQSSYIGGTYVDDLLKELKNN